MGKIPYGYKKECNEYAERVIKKLQTDGKWHSLRKQVSKGVEESSESTPTAEVFIDQVDHSVSRELGPLLIGCKIWNLLGFQDILSEAGLSTPQIKTAQISILNRLIIGDSEHSIPYWIKTTAVEDLIDKKASWSNINATTICGQSVEEKRFNRKKVI